MLKVILECKTSRHDFFGDPGFPPLTPGFSCSLNGVMTFDFLFKGKIRVCTLAWESLKLFDKIVSEATDISQLLNMS